MMNVKELREIKNKLLKDYTTIKKLCIIYELDESTPFKQLTEIEQSFIIDLLYNYYMDSEQIELEHLLQNFINWLHFNFKSQENILHQLKDMIQYSFLELNDLIDNIYNEF